MSNVSVVDNPVSDVRDLLLEAEVAPRLGLKNAQTLAVYRCLGLRGRKNFTLRHYKIGRRIYYSEGDIAAYIAAQQRG